MLRGDYGEIRIGARTSIQDGTVLHTTEETPRSSARTASSSTDLAHLEGCLVGDRVLIGSNSVVLNRAVIEDGALVGACVLVAEGTLVPLRDHRPLGVPARVREGAGTAAFVESAVAMYVENARRYRSGLTVVD